MLSKIRVIQRCASFGIQSRCRGIVTSLLASLTMLALTSCISERANQLGIVSITNFSVVDASNGIQVHTINQGQSVVLSWVVAGASSISISDGSGPVKNAVAVSGNSIKVTPSATTTYTLTATGMVQDGLNGTVKNGSVSILATDGSPAAVTVTVVPLPVISSFTATPTTATYGENVTLNWTVSNARNMTIAQYNSAQNIWGVGQDVTGTSSLTLQPTTTGQFQLYASSLSDVVTTGASAVVEVQVYPQPGAILRASKSMIPIGGSSLLTWTSTNATELFLKAVDANNPAGVLSDVSQVTNELVSPSITTTYTMLAKNSIGYTVPSLPVTVEVSACSPPDIALFAASPVSTGPNKTVALTAVFDGGQPGDIGAATIDNGIGSVTSGVPATSSVLSATTSFHLAVNNNCGSSSKATARVPVGNLTLYAGQTSNGYRDGPVTSASFQTPSGITRDSQGNLYISDYAYNDIRKITPSGDVSTLAGVPDFVPGYLDGPAPSALFSSPAGLAVDSNGNVYVADNVNNVIRVITPGTTATVSTLAGGFPNFQDGTGISAGFNRPYGLALGPKNTLYVADTVDQVIRTVNIGTGEVKTLAGSPPTATTINNDNAGYQDGVGTLAKFHNPTNITLSADGNLYVSDSINNVIRKVTPDGTVTTVAGQAGIQGQTDGDGLTAALFGSVGAIASDESGTLYVADGKNYTIRRLTPGVNGFAVDTIIGTPKTFSLNPGGQLPGKFNNSLGIVADPTSETLYMTARYGVFTAPY